MADRVEREGSASLPVKEVSATFLEEGRIPHDSVGGRLFLRSLRRDLAEDGRVTNLLFVTEQARDEQGQEARAGLGMGRPYGR